MVRMILATGALALGIGAALAQANVIAVSGPMGSVVRHTAHLSDADRAAMAEYILSLPPREGKGLESVAAPAQRTLGWHGRRISP